MNPKRIWELVKASVSAWIDDYAPSMGAALAYYTLFSIAPLLVIVIAIAGLVFGAEAAQGAIVAQLDGLIGHEGAVAVQGLLKSASEPGQGVIATDCRGGDALDRRDDRIRGIAERTGPHLGSPGGKKSERNLVSRSPTAAVARNGAGARPAHARFPGPKRRARGARHVVGRLLRRLGSCAARDQLCRVFRA